MAKSKKPAGEPKKTEAKKTEAKKSAEKKPVAAVSGPTVDTALAAQSAARLLAAGVSNKPAEDRLAASGAPAKAETAMFKQLKSGLAKPASQAMSNLLDKHGGPEQKKLGLPFSGTKQVGKNQTFGADVNRAGVPRRTGGG